MAKVRIEYKIVNPNAKFPTRAYEHDAALDLYSVEAGIIEPGQTRNFDTGIIFVAPPGWYTTINGRSSMNKRGILAFRGVIDATYQGTMQVSLTNTSPVSYEIKIGDRVGQITIHERHDFFGVEVEQFSEEYSSRGNRGFGSSGV